jgi:peptide chain release factor 3
VGTVGNLQFDVIQHRLRHEYGADCRFTSLPFYRACWITGEDKAKLDKFINYYQRRIAVDRDGEIVFFSEGQWELNYVQRENPDIEFHFTSEFKLRRDA